MRFGATPVPIAVIAPAAGCIPMEDLPFVGEDVVRLNRERELAQPLHGQIEPAPGVHRPEHAGMAQPCEQLEQRRRDGRFSVVVHQGAVKIGAQQSNHPPNLIVSGRKSKPQSESTRPLAAVPCRFAGTPGTLFRPDPFVLAPSILEETPENAFSPNILCIPSPRPPYSLGQMPRKSCCCLPAPWLDFGSSFP